MSELAAKAEELRRRHFADGPLVVLNVWDAASARVVADAGHPVIATSSAAVASSLGRGDHEHMSADEAFGAIERIANAVSVPVTADIESGYELSPLELAHRLIDAGAVGCNLEDSDHHGGEHALVDAERQAQRIHEVCAAASAYGVPVVVNARVDVYLGAPGSARQRSDEAIRRACMYLDAGATCVYPIGLTDRDEIDLLVRELAAPVNIWLRKGGPPLAALQQLGVARISVAAALQNAAMRAIGDISSAILDGDDTRLLSGRETRD